MPSSVKKLPFGLLLEVVLPSHHYFDITLDILQPRISFMLIKPCGIFSEGNTPYKQADKTKVFPGRKYHLCRGYNRK